jgi:Domain of unknown function (DUF4158)
MLCYLRFPGRILQQGEQPPAALCAFVAEQLGLDAAHFGDYAERDQTRREHVLEIETLLGLRPLTRVLYRELAACLLPTALATDHGPTLVTILLEELPVASSGHRCPAIERLAGSVRARAQRQLWRRPADGLTDQQRQSLDQLLEVRVGGGQSTLAWLRQTAYAATTGNFPKLIERLSMVRALGIEPERATRVHQNHWLKLAREGGQSTVHHLAELEPLRRYATLTATLTDEALNMFEHLVGQLFKRSERAHAEQFHARGKSPSIANRSSALASALNRYGRSPTAHYRAEILELRSESPGQQHRRPDLNSNRGEQGPLELTPGCLLIHFGRNSSRCPDNSSRCPGNSSRCPGNSNRDNHMSNKGTRNRNNPSSDTNMGRTRRKNGDDGARARRYRRHCHVGAKRFRLHVSSRRVPKDHCQSCDRC